MCACAYIYVYIHIYIDGVASQNANHFWGNCESLWQSESQYCESLSDDLQITFQIISKKDLFLVLTTFLEKIFAFLHTF